MVLNKKIIDEIKTVAGSPLVEDAVEENGINASDYLKGLAAGLTLQALFGGWISIEPEECDELQTEIHEELGRFFGLCE